MGAISTREGDLEDPGRASFTQTQEQFESILELHDAQPWTKRKSNQLYALLEECENNDERNLIIDLLSAYENFDEEKTYEAFSNIKLEITNNWKLAASNTLIAAMHNSDDPGSAPSILQQIKNHFHAGDWQKGNFICHLKPTLHKITDGTNIVFIDDFIGTGGQFSEIFDWFMRQVKDKGVALENVYLTSLCIMKQALPEIEKRNIKHFGYHYMEKGITGRLSGEKLVKAKQLMEQLENRLRWHKKNRKLYSFGFKQSEALFRFMDNNAPNNNFPIFWWKETAEGSRRQTMQVRL